MRSPIVPFFSVVIPTHNRASLLREALESVFAQEFADYEVIVVDDGSTDETREVVSAFGERVRFFRQDNKGPGAARNLGIQNANGDFVAFLDCDDLWLPWTLAIYSQAIEKHDHTNMIAGNSLPFGEGRSPASSDRPYAHFTHFSDFLEASVQKYAFAGTPGLAIRAIVLRAAGGFMENSINGEDQDLCLRLGAVPGFVQIDAPPVFLQRVHADRVSIDIVKSLAGVEVLLQRERLGQYPGGFRARKVRRAIITAAARSVSLNAAASGRIRDAARLYRDTFLWHIQLGRLKYLLGFPVFVLKYWTKAKRA